MQAPFLREWFKRDIVKPILLLGTNSLVKSALVYTNFDIYTEIIHMSSRDRCLMTRTYDANKVYLILDEVSGDTIDYDYTVQLANDIGIHFIIIPSEYVQPRIDENRFIRIEVKDVYPGKDWYWYCTELEKAGKFHD